MNHSYNSFTARDNRLREPSDDSDDAIGRWVPVRSAKRRLSYDLDDHDNDDNDDDAGTSAPRSRPLISVPSALVPYTNDDEDTGTSVCRSSTPVPGVSSTDRLNDNDQSCILSGFAVLERDGEAYEIDADFTPYVPRGPPPRRRARLHALMTRATNQTQKKICFRLQTISYIECK